MNSLCSVQPIFSSLQTHSAFVGNNFAPPNHLITPKTNKHNACEHANPKHYYKYMFVLRTQNHPYPGRQSTKIYCVALLLLTSTDVPPCEVFPYIDEQPRRILRTDHPPSPPPWKCARRIDGHHCQALAVVCSMDILMYSRPYPAYPMTSSENPSSGLAGPAGAICSRRGNYRRASAMPWDFAPCLRSCLNCWVARLAVGLCR